MVNWVFIVVIGFLVLLLAIVLIVIIIKKSKGKIEIKLNDYNFVPGKVVNGTINLDMKKPLEGILKVGLEGVYKSKSYGKNSYKSSSGRNAYNIEIPITPKVTFPVGKSQSEFKFQVPGDVGNLLNQGAIGNAIRGAQLLLSGTVTQIDWYFYARLDMKGLDLKKRVKVSVSGGGQGMVPGAMY